ncbi:MAG TPA: glycoside hydrolase family 57 protein [Terriglobales bacterium]|nr:glycoside hydrolase family 57 protein [Terriglobales bacterium]
MPAIRVVVLWHQHQPFYKDLVTGEYRLPWVRLHGLKDYYGMVKLLDEFPEVHQTFNLVPSLIAQIQDYVTGTARDPFLNLAAKPARDFTIEERHSALLYLFQANPVHLIGRYPRYQELWERFRGSGNSPERAEKFFQPQDFTDLQVLSQIAWFDEFFLDQPDISALIRKGHGYSLEDQQFVIQQERELLAQILPAHASAAKRGLIEISTSPFYHPIMPLVCDTSMGAVSSANLPLPQNRFQRTEDAREQLLRGLDLHERVFGVRPRGVWPSEGSVSEEVLAIASSLGVKWMATDEGVLGRSLGMFFSRDDRGRLDPELADKLYTIYKYETPAAQMNMIFRDHTLSDLIGFVYSGMHAQEAAAHLIQNIKDAAQPIIDQGLDAMVPIILDGENAWEYYPQSGREFLRRFYDGLQSTPGIAAVTVSEAIQRYSGKPRLKSIVPGSWINANFNVWIGAPEDNRAWDYLFHAREFYQQTAPHAPEEKRKLAFEEILIAEGSDWNWWYGPEHHSANDRDFDELYRKHLSNVYHALGATPPDYLAQPIIGAAARPSFVPQTAYIHPRISGDMVRYFEWIGAAMYTADQRSGSMHGKRFVLDSVYAGIDEANVYGRLDFADGIPDTPFELVVNLESWAAEGQRPRRSLRLDVTVQSAAIQSWSISQAEEDQPLASSDQGQAANDIKLVIQRNFELKLPLAWLLATPIPSSEPRKLSAPVVTRVRLRFSMWQNKLPIDALPLEGWIELQLLTENELAASAY